MEAILKQLEELYPEMVELRRYFHQHPELSFHEVNTPAKIADYLMDLGIEVRSGVGGRGVVGYIRGSRPGKTVALRADFDALPIQEENDVPYKSKVPGVMHACGHDAHTAALLVTAKVLSGNRDKWKGNIVLIHQYAEEIAPGGAKPMIEDGCLDGVDAIFGTHIWSSFDVGEIRYRMGPVMAAADRFELKVKGRGGHGASPHETIDSIAVTVSIIQQLQQIVSRRINPLKPAVLTVASIHAGDAFNVIAGETTIIGTVRTFDPCVQEEIIVHMEKIIASNCENAGADYEFNYQKGYPAVVNHDQETLFLAGKAIEIMGADHVKEMEPVMGGEDFSYYLEKVPGTFFFTGGGNAAKGFHYPHHHPKFDIDERSMLHASKILLSAAMHYLNES